MKRTIGLAALLGTLAAGVFATNALAQCSGTVGTGMLISFNNGDVFAWDSLYDAPNYAYPAGTELKVVGFVNQFCAPLDGEAPNGTTEYTFYWRGLTSGGTSSSPFGTSGTRYDTDFTGGTFEIYKGSPKNAPTAATIGGFGPPPNGTVPVTFRDGTLILTGVFLDPLHVAVTRSSLNNWSGSLNGLYQFTGGTLYNKVGGATANVNGLWCAAYVAGTGSANGRCTLPAGYSGHPSGKWDSPSSTSAQPTTWGAIQQLYR